jgi:hypothetical protein
LEYLIAFGSDPQDVTLTTSGLATAADFHRMKDELLADARFRAPMNILVDHSELSASPLTDGEIRNVARSVTRLSSQFGTSKVAIVAPRALTFGLSRAALSMADTSALEVKVFGVQDNALRWLQRKPYLVEPTDAPTVEE